MQNIKPAARLPAIKRATVAAGKLTEDMILSQLDAAVPARFHFNVEGGSLFFLTPANARLPEDLDDPLTLPQFISPARIGETDCLIVCRCVLQSYAARRKSDAEAVLILFKYSG